MLAHRIPFYNKPKINNSTVDDRNISQIDINKMLNWPTENAERFSNFELVIRYDLNLEPCRGVYSHYIVRSTVK